MSRAFLFVSALVTACMVASAQGALVVQPIGATADSAYGPATKADFTRSGAGLSDPAIVETNDPVPTDWPTHSTGSNNVNWLSGSSTGDALRWIEFDLGQAFPLAGLHVWNNNQASQSDRGFRVVDILTSLDGMSYTKVADDLILARATESDTYAGETYWLDMGQARYVRIEGYKSQNWGDGSYIGLSEVRLIAVPEPTAMSVLLLGCAALVRRRR